MQSKAVKSVDEAPVIRARGLARRYSIGQEKVRALNGVDLDVAAGEFVALVGPSGSGKSTLLNLIGSLDRPSDGEIHVAGLELGRANDRELVRYRRTQIGFIFQSFNLLPTRSAVENVEIPLTLAEVKPRERRERALQLLEAVGLGRRANHKPNQMSGGEMQRVAVARSLANRPLLLLADEPTGNLDSKTGREILNLLCEAVSQRGVTLVLVTHDAFVASFADRVVHMLDGKIQRIEINASNASIKANRVLDNATTPTEVSQNESETTEDILAEKALVENALTTNATGSGEKR